MFVLNLEHLIILNTSNTITYHWFMGSRNSGSVVSWPCENMCCVLCLTGIILCPIDRKVVILATVWQCNMIVESILCVYTSKTLLLTWKNVQMLLYKPFEQVLLHCTMFIIYWQNLDKFITVIHKKLTLWSISGVKDWLYNYDWRKKIIQNRNHIQIN